MTKYLAHISVHIARYVMCTAMLSCIKIVYKEVCSWMLYWLWYKSHCKIIKILHCSHSIYALSCSGNKQDVQTGLTNPPSFHHCLHCHCHLIYGTSHWSKISSKDILLVDPRNCSEKSCVLIGRTTRVIGEYNLKGAGHAQSRVMKISYILILRKKRLSVYILILLRRILFC